ncbi:MAG: helix-turn-helix transcriptional regulator, partial [Eubacteriales bacterium]|nr:helix-turn-helix transcriptional regulator [Eubacteriales bacterium]
KNLVSNYENGISTPDIYTLVKLADIFDITLDELVGRE